MSPQSSVSQEPFRTRCTTAPPRSLHSSISSQEISLTSQGSPLSTAPGIVGCKAITDVDTSPVSSARILCMVASPQKVTLMAEPELQSYEFGKCMHIYAKKKYNSKTTPPRTSISDGNICEKTNNVKMNNSYSQPFNKPNLHHSHQQCCSGFGSAGRHRFQSNACNIV